MRRLIEQTTLTYGEIAARTGVGRASICRWTRDGGWKRPPFAPRATDTVPRARASAQLKRRTLAARLAALAERYIRELEQSADIDPDKLGEALELLKMAKVAARPRHGKRPRRDGAAAPPATLTHRGARSWNCASPTWTCTARPRAAVEDFLANRAPPAEKPRRERGRRLRRSDYHAWMMEKER